MANKIPYYVLMLLMAALIGWVLFYLSHVAFVQKAYFRQHMIDGFALAGGDKEMENEHPSDQTPWHLKAPQNHIVNPPQLEEVKHPANKEKDSEELAKKQAQIRAGKV